MSDRKRQKYKLGLPLEVGVVLYIIYKILHNLFILEFVNIIKTMGEGWRVYRVKEGRWVNLKQVP